MIQKSFDAIGKADIDALIEHCVNESRTLEYKQNLPGLRDKDKKEFLRDVSSFGNAAGGDIIYGLKAAVDAEGKKTGAPGDVVPISGVTADEAKLWLEDVIRTSIEPRLLVQIKEITGWGDDASGFVILIRISNSYASPHMVTYKGGSEFHSRNSAGKFKLDVHELRTAFLATESQAERIRNWKQERLARIVADETPVELSSPHRLVLHVLPITPFFTGERINASVLEEKMHHFPPVGVGGFSWRYNLEGIVNYSPWNAEGGHDAYCQLHFNGSLESVDSDVLREVGGTRVNGGVGYIGSIAYERDVVQAVVKYLEGYKQFGITPPVALSLSLLGCKGSQMYCGRETLRGMGHPIDRDVALMPDVVIDDLSADIPRALRPLFDAVWNTCGFAGSLNYDNAGSWTAG